MKSMIMKCFVALSVCVTMIACNTDLEEDIEKEKVVVEDPTQKGSLEFDVSLAENSVLKVGDTVRFELTGNSDMVDFYSGAFGNAYDYIDKDRFYDIIANLSFRSGKAPANGSVSNYDCARLLYSTDFNGDRSSTNAYTNVKAATWTPITGFALPATPAAITDYVNSGIRDISPIFEEGKPVYLAWHCTTQAASSRVQFRVIESSIQGVVVDNSSLSKELYTQGQLDFRWVENPASAEQPGTNRPSVSTTQLQWSGVFNNNTTNMTAGQTHPMIGQFKEGYAISVPLELPQFNAGKDKPTVLLPKNDGTWTIHKYVYNKPGTYEVVFVASNLKADGGSSEIMKTLTITIEE